MASLLKRLFTGKSLPEQLSYEEGRSALEARKHKLEEELAGHPDAEPEMLYYLAERGSAKTRRAVARNPSTPAQANLLLAADNDEEVRGELARKIGRLLPDLLSSDREVVCNLTLETLEHLAADQVAVVRAILAEEIKSLTCVPRKVIAALARDLEDIVAVPIVEYSPLLWDDDLVEIVTSARAKGALAAVARRRGLSDKVSDAIVATLDSVAIAALLNNQDARIREATMERLVDQAEKTDEWQAPLAMRADLSMRVIRRIAGFVGAALLERLAERNDLDEDTKILLNRGIRARLEKDDLQTHIREEKAVAAVHAAAESGKLNEAFVESGAEDGHREVVVEALSVLSRVPKPVVEKIFSSRSAKGITALAWRAGVSMRVAFKIQVSIAKLAGSELLPARDGVHFPLSEQEMRWHLSYFGVSQS